MASRLATVTCRNIVKTTTSCCRTCHGGSSKLQNNNRQFGTSAAVNNARELTLGEGTTMKWRFDHEAVARFSELTNNRDPLHMDPKFAKKSEFGKPTVHWSLIHGALSGCAADFMTKKRTSFVTLNQFVEHPDPLYIGEEIQMELKVEAKTGRAATLAVTAVELNSGRVVAKGKGEVLMPKATKPKKKTEQ